MEKKDKVEVTRESDKFMLRLPEGMRDRIAEAAKANGRSMNAEIVARLHASFEAPEAKTDMQFLADLVAERVAEKLAGK